MKRIYLDYAATTPTDPEVVMKKKVLVAMSGGVDSSVASFLLKEEGYEVVGLTMCLGINEGQSDRPRCCGAQAIEDARRVCRELKIPHYIMDFSMELNEKVINNFVSEYLKGRTPNPCIDCNRYIKFGALLKKAISMGFDFLATGHYAKIERNKDTCFLKIPKDRIKDQTYFLYPIKKDLLKFILFPLADFTKDQVRAIARQKNLPVAEKPQSQDICFIPQSDYRRFLLTRIKVPKPGPIINSNGDILGEHKGIVFYTIGQRQGLGISYKSPLYVISIDAHKNQIIVGEKKDLKARGFIAGNLNLLVEDFPEEVFAKIRYAHKEARCKISLEHGKAKVIFKESQVAVTPGQSAVFYNNGVVLGGGVIQEASGAFNRKD